MVEQRGRDGTDRPGTERLEARDLGVGRRSWRDWVAEGGHTGMRGVCVCLLAGVISTKSVPYDTHSHGLCLDSLSFLSV